MKFLHALVLSLIFIAAGYTQNPCPGNATISYGGKTYNTVQIGNQCWLKENLDIGTLINGSLEQTNNGTLKKFCYNDDPANFLTYGGLYQWAEAIQYKFVATPSSTPVQGICPPGWHIPDTSEFVTLANAVNNNGNSLKAVGQGTGNGAGTNTSGFSALFAGTRFSDGTFSLLTLYNFFLSSTEFDAGNVYFFDLGSDSNFVFFGKNSKLYGRSVRCLQDVTRIGGVNCPNSFGYWKNHSDRWPNVFPMMLGTLNGYDKDKLMKILHTPVRGDASIILAYQLISAKLNVANNSKFPVEIQKAITNADNLIGSSSIPAKVRPNSNTGHKMILLAGLLDLYNNGRLTHCGNHDKDPRHESDIYDQPESDNNNLLGSEQDYKLLGNFPNPFNPTTKISFVLPQDEFVTLKIYNSLGQLVRTLVNAKMDKGTHTVEWNATGENGSILASGIYFYRIEAGNFVQTSKMIYMK
jgi:uncharacterized protein (TIGR02145 family)